MKYIKKYSCKKILEILKNQSDRSGYFEIATVYVNPRGDAKNTYSKYLSKLP